MTNHAHLDFPRVAPDHAGMDDVGLYSESHQPRPGVGHRSLPLPDNWPTRRAHIEPFGGCPCSAGNAACDCGLFGALNTRQGGASIDTTSAQPHVIDRMSEDYDEGYRPPVVNHARQRWLIATALMVIGGVIAAVCIAGYLRVLRWQLACLQDEQRLYIDTGHAGPIFERNSRQQQLEVMARIRQLESNT